MSLSRVKTWIAGEVLTASDLNTEVNNILSNAADLISPLTKAISMGGFALNFDAANTMSLVASTKGLNLSSTTAINDVFTTVASATAPDIWTAIGGVVDYTGTATATSFAAAPQAGASRTLVCAGAAVFTAGANMLIQGVASGANFTAEAGDMLVVTAITTTQFRIVVHKTSGGPIVGQFKFPATQNASTDVNTLDDYQEETWTGTLTGCTTSPTYNIHSVKIGKVVTMDIPSSGGTSNATSKTITGMPAKFRPSTAKLMCVVGASDNGGTTVIAYMTIGTNGTLSFSATIAGANWTASGTCSISQISVSYTVN